MADSRVSQLTEMSAADVAASDLAYIIDVSAGINGSKKILAQNILDAITRTASGGIIRRIGDKLRLVDPADANNYIDFYFPATNQGAVELSTNTLSVITLTGFRIKQAAVGNPLFTFDIAAGLKIRADRQLLFTSGADSDAAGDVGIIRDRAGVLRDTDGTNAGIGARFTKKVVEDSSATVASPNDLLPAESRLVITNDGVLSLGQVNLPSAAVGLEYEFVIKDANGLRIRAAAGDVIHFFGGSSTAGGYIQSTTIRSTIRLLAVDSTNWYATSVVGTWVNDNP